MSSWRSYPSGWGTILRHGGRSRGIRAAMQRKLWQPRAGVFAEALDTAGHRLLHPEPELATLYHAAEFGAADPLQLWQMLFWGDTAPGVRRTAPPAAAGTTGIPTGIRTGPAPTPTAPATWFTARR